MIFSYLILVILSFQAEEGNVKRWISRAVDNISGQIGSSDNVQRPDCDTTCICRW
jgi:hypothetical protein